MSGHFSSSFTFCCPLISSFSRSATRSLSCQFSSSLNALESGLHMQVIQYVYYNVILKIYNAYIHLATSMNYSKFQYTFYCRYCRQTSCLDNFQVPTRSVLTSLVSPEGQLLAASVSDFPHPGMPLDLVCMGNTVYVMYILLCHLYYSYIRLIQRYDISGSILTCS